MDDKRAEMQADLGVKPDDPLRHNYLARKDHALKHEVPALVKVLLALTPDGDHEPVGSGPFGY